MDDKETATGPDRGSPSSSNDKPPTPDNKLSQPSTTTTVRPTRTPALKDYLRVFTYATKWDFVTYAVASAASIATGITMPLMIIVFGGLIGDFSNFAGDSTSLSKNAFRNILDRQALLMMALFLARWALSATSKFCFRMIGIRLSSALRKQYMQALLAQSIHVIDSMPAGAPATAITATANTLQLGISERLGSFLEGNATVVSALIVAFVWRWDLTLVTLSLVVYCLVVVSVTLPLIVKKMTAMAADDAEGTAIASEALGGIRLVMACGAQDYVLGKYAKWVKSSEKTGHKLAPIIGANMGLLFFGMFGAFGLSFWYGTQRYIAGAVKDVGVVVVVLMSVMLILMSINNVSTPLTAISKAIVAACEFFIIIDAPLPPSGGDKPDITSQDLILDDVVFEYPSRPGTRVLDHLSIRIPAGKNTALVGPSGSGKSTIVALIERWYSLRGQQALPALALTTADKNDKKKKEKDKNEEHTEQSGEKSETETTPEISGSLSVGQHNIEDVDLQWWRSQIGLVQQEPFLFNQSIFTNVEYGLVGTQWADESEELKRKMVQEACKEAYADEFISRLPDGYDTQVGDGGIKLSGGQKQRIAIARSIIKKPQIMILDEATSAIDVHGERIVQAALDRATQFRTTITIAHRLSTIQKADNIIVLKRGKAVEQGTHKSLMDAGGTYSLLVHGQSLRLSASSEGNDSGDVASIEDHKHNETTIAITAEAEMKTKNNVDEEKGTGAGVGNSCEEEAKKPCGLAKSFWILFIRQRKLWPLYMADLFFVACTAAAMPLQAWLFAKVVGVFLLRGQQLKTESSFWGLMWLALASGVGLSYLGSAWCGFHGQYSVSATCKSQYLGDLLYQKLAFFDEPDHAHGTLSARVAGDAKQVEELLGLNLNLTLIGLLQVLGCVTIALAFAWKLGLIALFITMPIMLASGWWKCKQEVYFDQMNAAVFMASSQFATEAIGAIRTVASLTMEDSINARYQALLSGHVRSAQKKAQWVSPLHGFAESVGLGCQALIFWYGGQELAKGTWSMEAFFVCFIAIIYGAEGASSILGVAPNAAQAAAAAKRILDVEEFAMKREDKDETLGTPESWSAIPDTEGGVEVELCNVSFRYPTRDMAILASLSLKIERGQFAAFVGPSGCGKTTIISLLERFYDVQPGNGEILCNGVNINAANVFDYRRGLSLVAQEPVMFRGTIRDNILLGMQSVTEDRIYQVCRDAFIHDFIVSLPEGYDTDVGQKGVTMSGGQKQRIAIARALIRDPKLLLLDEATSALDSGSEKIVQAAFERGRAGRTMIAVAHRLSTIQNADVIFVIDQGRLVEKGTHNELVRLQGVYWAMCQTQALDQ